MDPSFSIALKLNDANATTTYVLWSMIIFLIILIGGIIFTVFKQMNRLQRLPKVEDSKFKSQKAKGFQ